MRVHLRSNVFIILFVIWSYFCWFRPNTRSIQYAFCILTAQLSLLSTRARQFSRAQNQATHHANHIHICVPQLMMKESQKIIYSTIHRVINGHRTVRGLISVTINHLILPLSPGPFFNWRGGHFASGNRSQLQFARGIKFAFSSHRVLSTGCGRNFIFHWIKQLGDEKWVAVSGQSSQQVTWIWPRNQWRNKNASHRWAGRKF